MGAQFVFRAFWRALSGRYELEFGSHCVVFSFSLDVFIEDAPRILSACTNTSGRLFRVNQRDQPRAALNNRVY